MLDIEIYGYNMSIGQTMNPWNLILYMGSLPLWPPVWINQPWNDSESIFQILISNTLNYEIHLFKTICVLKVKWYWTYWRRKMYENVSIPKREIDPQRWRTLDKASLNSLNSVANPTAEIRVCWCSLAILSCRSWVWDGVGAALRQELSSTMAINGMTLCSKIDCYYPTWQFMSLLTWSKANFSILKCFSCLYN